MSDFDYRDPDLLSIVRQQESSNNPNAVSNKGALGLMQTMPATLRDPGYGVAPAKDHSKEELQRVGEDYLAAMGGKYKNSNLALMAYNWGPTNVDQWLKNGANPSKIPEQTKNYVKNINENYRKKKSNSEIVQVAGAQEPVAYVSQSSEDTTDPRKKLLLDSLKEDDVPEQIDPRKKALLDSVHEDPESQSKGSIFDIPDLSEKDLKGLESPVTNRLTREAAGNVQGARDVMSSLQNMTGHPTLGGMLPSEEENTTARNAFNEKYERDPIAGMGRFGANLGVSLPLMIGGGEAIGGAGALASKVLPKVAPAIDFVTGNVAASNPVTKFASNRLMNAGQGAAAQSLVSSQSDTPLSSQLIGGAALGALTGAIPAAVGELYQGAKKIAQPLYEKGRSAIVDEMLNSAASGGPIKINDKEIIPGSYPTLSAATGNPEIATRERQLRSQFPNAFNDRINQNNQARMAAWDKIQGDDHSLKNLYQDRDQQTATLRDAAFAKKSPVDPKSVVDKIDSMLKGPEGKIEAVRTNLQKVRDNLLDGSGNIETDPEILYGVRKDIATNLSNQAAKSGSTAQLAASQLHSVMKALDTTIEKGAPGYAQYMKKFSELSKPIDEQEFLQSRNVTSGGGHLTLAKVDTLIKNIEKSQSLGGVNSAKSISQNTMDTLQALREDLRREAHIDLGKARGSTTPQELGRGELGKNALMNIAAGAETLSGHPLIGAGLYAGRKFLGGQEAKITNQLLSKYLNPADAYDVFNPAPAAQGSRLKDYINYLVSKSGIPAVVEGNQNFQTNPK